MTLFEVDDTLTVGQLTRQLSEAVKRTFRADLWVQGQIRNLSRSGRGHVYFDLIEPVPSGAAPKASIAVTLFDSNRQVVNRIITRTGNSMRIEDGVEVRIRGTVELYVPRGQIQVNMTSIDPEFTLGRLGADRDQLLKALTSEGLLQANKEIPLPLVPLRVALITSDGSAAHADFVNQIAAGGYAFDVTTIGTRVQGTYAPEEIAESIERCQSLPVDVIAVVRGGGARTDLAAFDTEPVARAIATSRLPVLAGIGHEIDQSVADLVAHGSFKTPTACAQFLIERLVAFDFALAERAERLRRRAVVAPALQLARVDRAADRVAQQTHSSLDRAESRNHAAAIGLERRVARRISRASDRLAERQARVRLAAGAALTRADQRCTDGSSHMRAAAERQLQRGQHHLDLFEARRSALDPAQALRRGWSITTTKDGRLVRSSSDVEPGTQLTTRVADGTIASDVTATTSTSPASARDLASAQHDQESP